MGFALSDLPWSFIVTAAGGERVTVYVDENLETVTVTVQVADPDGRLVAQVRRDGGRRLRVSRAAPEVVVEHADGGSTEVELTPSLRVAVRWPMP